MCYSETQHTPAHTATHTRPHGHTAARPHTHTHTHGATYVPRTLLRCRKSGADCKHQSPHSESTLHTAAASSLQPQFSNAPCACASAVGPPARKHLQCEASQSMHHTARQSNQTVPPARTSTEPAKLSNLRDHLQVPGRDACVIITYAKAPLATKRTVRSP